MRLQNQHPNLPRLAGLDFSADCWDLTKFPVNQKQTCVNLALLKNLSKLV
jgi:hypothetical protein